MKNQITVSVSDFPKRARQRTLEILAQAPFDIVAFTSEGQSFYPVLNARAFNMPQGQHRKVVLKPEGDATSYGIDSTPPLVKGLFMGTSGGVSCIPDPTTMKIYLAGFYRGKASDGCDQDMTRVIYEYKKGRSERDYTFFLDVPIETIFQVRRNIIAQSS